MLFNLYHIIKTFHAIYLAQKCTTRESPNYNIIALTKNRDYKFRTLLALPASAKKYTRVLLTSQTHHLYILTAFTINGECYFQKYQRLLNRKPQWIRNRVAAVSYPLVNKLIVLVYWKKVVSLKYHSTEIYCSLSGKNITYVR